MDEKTRDEYLDKIDNLIEDINAKLNQIDIKQEQSLLEKHLDAIDVQYLQLTQVLSDSKDALPSYNLRKIQESSNLIKSEIELKRNICFPRKRFTFKNKPSQAKIQQQPVTKSSKTSSGDTLGLHFALVGFRNQSQTDLELTREKSTGKDLELVNLDQCQVNITGNPSSVTINSCQNCSISIGPVSGSIFVKNCFNSKFQLLCHQLRIHTTHDCHFKVLFTSRGIIEDCEKIKISKYSYNYEQFEEDMTKSGLNLNQLSWSNIDDFNWLAKDKPSPNWSLV